MKKIGISNIFLQLHWFASALHLLYMPLDTAEDSNFCRYSSLVAIISGAFTILYSALFIFSVYLIVMVKVGEHRFNWKKHLERFTQFVAGVFIFYKFYYVADWG